MEKLTTEKIFENRKYFKENKSGKLEQTENYDEKEIYRVYGVKTLQAYIKEIEDFKTNQNYKVIEHYFKNSKEINLTELASGNGLTAMLGLLSKEIKSVEITRNFNLATGGIIVSAEIIYNVELF